MSKCFDCGIELSIYSENNKSIRCRSCENKRRHKLNIFNIFGKNNPNYIDSRCSKKYYCIDCKKQISLTSALYGNKRCNSCHGKYKIPTFGKLPTHGKRIEYNGIKFRSSWEYKFALWCDKNNIKWNYESKTFDLGNTTYTPDFYLSEFNLWIEIKGYWRDKAKEKFELFKQKYCGERIKIVQKQELKENDILKQGNLSFNRSIYGVS